jgi:glutamate-ammonia-ligase adenylyltransferase
MTTSELLALAWAIDPARAGVLERELGTSSVGRVLGVLLGACYPPLTPVLGWQVEALERIAGDGYRAARQRAELLGKTQSAIIQNPTDGAARALRRTVWEEKVRIALRELLPDEFGGADVLVTASELAALADAACHAALLEAEIAVATRFGTPRRHGGGPSALVVFGMGKLGGLELNAGSDIDILFVYDTDDGGSQIDLHEHWSRVARRLVATLDGPSADGIIWRVDLRLRPEGSQGPIVNSVAATERYYETWGRMWERAALLRARPVAGDLALGNEISREIFLPFVYRRDVDPSVATALAELVQRSRAELSPNPDRDLKLGPGGIREAEFFVQALQLIWGGREPSLRVAGTVPALERLRARGLVTDREARDVTRAYALLRRLEHRVQWMTGLQTHLLPEGELLAKLARSLGEEDEGPLLAELGTIRTLVSELFASLAPQAPRPVGRHQLTLLRLVEFHEDALRLVEQTFGTPEVADHLRALARRPDGLFGARTIERSPNLVEHVLGALAGAADVEQAARYLRGFFGRFADPASYVAALAEQPLAAQRLVTALGASAFVGDAIVGRPDLAEVILFEGGLPIDPRREVAIEVGATGSRSDDDYRDRFVAALRRAKRRTTIRVAVADLAGLIDTRHATRLLSDLADEILARSVELELGTPVTGLAVIAMGKLGGRDIGYGSDLDVLFIYDPLAAPNAEEAGPYFIKHAQRVLRSMSEPHAAGPGYALDTRLRPSGSHGLLVTSLEAFATYHGVRKTDELELKPNVLSSGAPWERQALLRARFCAGDPQLGQRVIDVAERAAYERGAAPASEMQRLRLRMQVEIARERSGRYDLKTGRGGLWDVEFAAQWLQMRHGADRRVRTTDTLDALDTLHGLGYATRADYDALRDGYVFLRRLEQRLHVLHGVSSTTLDSRHPGLPQLARRMGFQDSARVAARDALLSHYDVVTSEVRVAYERVLGLRDR